MYAYFRKHGHGTICMPASWRSSTGNDLLDEVRGSGGGRRGNDRSHTLVGGGVRGGGGKLLCAGALITATATIDQYSLVALHVLLAEAVLVATAAHYTLSCTHTVCASAHLDGKVGPE